MRLGGQGERRYTTAITITIVTMASEPTTIQVSRPTAERLAALKVPGLTYDDVIKFLLDGVSAEEVRNLFREWQESALKKILADPSVRRGVGSKKTD